MSRQITEEIAKCCKKLMLSQRAVELCREQATPRQEEFLLQVLQSELKQREEKRKAAQLKRAKFPLLKSLIDYEWGHIRFPRELSIQSLSECAFIDAKQNLVLYGPVGTGKTHLALGIGLAACEKGYEVRFHNIAQLAVKLMHAYKAGTLESAMKELSKAHLLILDEWGYLPLDRESAQLLFRVIAESYEQRSVILTTNLEFSKWGGIFMDDQMTAAMIDRLAHHGHLLLFEGESYRMRHALMVQS